jgi:hypothetical protein
MVRYVLTPLVGAVLPVVSFVGLSLFEDLTGFRGMNRPPETPMPMESAWKNATQVDALSLLYVAGVLVFAVRAVIRRLRGTWREGL